MKKTLGRIIFFCLLAVMNLQGQEIWPGDINNNGEVNGVDLLYFGVAIDATGPARTNMGTEWEAKTIDNLWSNSFPSGLNYAYADCDGNGVIDDDDHEAIEDNFKEEHGTVFPDVFLEGTPNINPPLKIQGPLVANANSNLSLDISLGTAALPISDFYGINFKIHYNPNLIDSDEIEFNLIENAWIGYDDDFVTTLYVNDEVSGTLDVSITRITHTTVSGYGQIGKLDIVIEDNVVDFIQDTLVLEIDDIMMVSDNLVASPITETKHEIAIDSTVTTNEVSEQNINIYPNPVNNILSIQHNDLVIRKIECFDSLGKLRLLDTKTSNHSTNVDLSAFQSGVYFLKIYTLTGIVSRKVLVQQ